jgi:hypothetical protein
MHKERRARYQTADTNWGKVIVMGMLDRTARQIRTEIVPNVDRDTLQAQVLNNIKYGTRVYTDQSSSYSHLGRVTCTKLRESHREVCRGARPHQWP